MWTSPSETASDIRSFQPIPTLSRWVRPVHAFGGIGCAFSLIFTGALVYILMLTNAIMVAVLFWLLICLSCTLIVL